MKKGLCLLLTTVLLLTTAFSAIGEESGEVLCLPKNEVLVDGQIVFNDKAVQRAIRYNENYIRSGVNGLKKIETLEITDEDMPAVDLSVLQLLTGLEELEIDASQLKSLEPLTKCKKLNYLHIKNANGLDLEPITRMNKLIALQFTQCDNLDIQTITGSKSLALLQLEHTPVDDLAFLSSIKKLAGFFMAFTDENAPSIAPIADCKKLRFLGLYDNQQPLTAIVGLTKLQDLQIVRGTMEGFSELAGANAKSLTVLGLNSTGALTESQSETIGSLTKLKELSLALLDSVNLTGLSGCKALEKIEIYSCGGEVDLSSLGKPTKLKELRLEGVEKLLLPDLTSAKKLTTIEMVDIQDTGDLSVLGKLPKLETLALYQLRNVQLAGIEKLPALKDLTINRVEETDFSFVTRAPKLTTLASLCCRPTDHAFLNELSCKKTLSTVVLGDETLADIDFVHDLKKLTSFTLLDTKVANIQPLESATKLDTVILSGNPIDDYSVLEGLAKLDFIVLDDSVDDAVVNSIENANPSVYVHRTQVSELARISTLATRFYGETIDAE